MGTPPLVVGPNGKIISTGYTPRVLQAELHVKLRRFTTVVCHRRFGKSVWAINHLIDKALRCTLPNPRFAYIAPTYGQAKRIAWDYLKHYTQDIPGVEYNEAELRVEIPSNNARIMLLSAENPNSLRGIYLDGVVLDEYAEMDPTAWTAVIRPALSDRRGFAIFLGTPKGQNHFYEHYEYGLHGKDGVLDPEWASFMFKASQTGIVDKGELDSARRTMTEEEFNQEYECDFNAGLVGAYFAKELATSEKEGRITRVPYDSSIPVDTYWDLGTNDLAAIWFVQSLRVRHHVIDYYEVSGSSIPQVLQVIREKGYTFGRFNFPHDVKNKSFIGTSQLETFYNHGVRNYTVIPRVGTKREGINAARMIFSKCYFDAVKCKQGLRALANYQRKWDAKNNVFQDNPLHNWASNGADAFQQFGLGAREHTASDDFINQLRGSGSPRGELKADGDFNPLRSF
jgi:phage terminase large subunit